MPREKVWEVSRLPSEARTFLQVHSLQYVRSVVYHHLFEVLLVDIQHHIYQDHRPNSHYYRVGRRQVVDKGHLRSTRHREHAHLDDKWEPECRTPGAVADCYCRPLAVDEQRAGFGEDQERNC